MNQQTAQVLEAYLCNGWSQRTIQERILEIDAPERGGGYEAMKILHQYGIEGEHKSALKGCAFDADALEAAGDIRPSLRGSVDRTS